MLCTIVYAQCEHIQVDDMYHLRHVQAAQQAIERLTQERIVSHIFFYFSVSHITIR